MTDGVVALSLSSSKADTLEEAGLCPNRKLTRCPKEKESRVTLPLSEAIVRCRLEGDPRHGAQERPPRFLWSRGSRNYIIFIVAKGSWGP